MLAKGVDRNINLTDTGYVKWFSELNKDSISIAGGKGANLSEIYNLGVPVPPGFVITTTAYNHFLDYASIRHRIIELLSKISYEDTKQLEEVTSNIRTIIKNAPMSKPLQEEIIEAYENLATEPNLKKNSSVNEILNKNPGSIFVAVRSSATAEDLADASFAGQQESFLNVKGKEDLIQKIKECFASLFTARATYYRNKKGFAHDKTSLAVVVQKMIDSDKSGVMFSKDPSYNDNNVIIEAVWGLGEGIVSGRVTPDRYVVSHDIKIMDKKILTKKVAITRDPEGKNIIVDLKEDYAKTQVLTDPQVRSLAKISLELEEHYKKPQDTEFAIENDIIYIVQTRPITTIGKRIDTREEGKEAKGEIILSGMAASPGIVSGKVKIVHELKDLPKVLAGDILVTEMTNPDMVVTMQRCAGIITDEGGMTAHASIISREMGIPCVVGTQEATKLLQDNQEVTVDGFNGKVYKGSTLPEGKAIKKEVAQVTAKTRTKIKVMVDLPSFAERSSKTGLKAVGLTRIEGIIAESGKHPNFFIQNKSFKEYENIVYKGVHEIARFFDEIWVRTSDIRSDEYKQLQGAPKEVEANPMLGMHGIRYGLKYPEILKAELKALKRVAEEGKKIGILLPQVILVDEVKKVKEFIDEIGFYNAKLGVMIETPAAVQIVKELCEEKINFISFGTNDLTQYMLAVDRGNEEVQSLYNEMHPSILYQLEYVIRVCKRNGVETSICGQAGSKKEMVEFLVKHGIDSISTNADVSAEIAEFVAELEKNIPEED